MMITKDTKLADLLQEYPWLKSEVMQISDKFKMLNTPVGKIMLKKATVAEMSKKSGIAEDQIIQKLTELIEKHK
ncbi:MAG: DUF1858 domain-containing protein [Mogibacterium sp.]|nr:DUF1858 domain-containing protein [Mogibacterium sp.]MBR2842083.1 DUF1858 domain-containing protein [Lachnospiraceae bacterium]MBR3246096.1 DUF1858 domain-containing protein [Parasporobacterium sp.]